MAHHARQLAGKPQDGPRAEAIATHSDNDTEASSGTDSTESAEHIVGIDSRTLEELSLYCQLSVLKIGEGWPR